MPPQKTIATENKKIKILLRTFLVLTAAYCVYYILSLITPSDTVISIDAYYHIAVTKFIKKYGFLKSFQWTQYSIWKVLYSDKDLLLHLIILPITYFTGKIALINKWGTAIINIIYFTVFACILRKYVHHILAGLLMLLCFTSPTYTTYLLYLRPAILALTFTILGIHFLTQKNKYAVFAVTFLFTLAHLSAFTLLGFAIISEVSRYILKKEFYGENIIYSFAGFLCGVLIHPNFPSNLITIYINGFLTPFYAFGEQGINFGKEMFSASAKSVLLNQIIVFIYFGVMFWKLWFDKVKISHAGFLFVVAAQFYFALGFTGNRFWFMAVPLATLAMAAFVKDAFFEDNASPRYSQMNLTIYAIICFFLIGTLPIRADEMAKKVKRIEAGKKAAEQAAYWMKENIPRGETVYHSKWGYSPFLICINPKNNYLVTLDPIYMYYWSAKIQKIYQKMAGGKEPRAYHHLKNTFKTRYGFTNTEHAFYKLIYKNPQFKILYNKDGYVVFEVLGFYE